MACWKWDSIEQFAHEADSIGDQHEWFGLDWFGNVTFSEAVEKSTRGDESKVPEAEKLMEQFEVDCEVKGFKWIRAPYGAYPCIPDYLSGSPTPMRLRRRVHSDVAPVNIFVSTTSSACIDADVMMKRGITILALLLKLQQIRPVQLYLLTELDGVKDGNHFQTIRVESQPLNTAVAAFALTEVGFARHLTYSVAKKLDDYHGAWPKDYHGDKNKYRAIRAADCGIGPDDLVIEAATEWDELVKKPVEWLQKQIAHYAGRDEQEQD